MCAHIKLLEDHEDEGDDELGAVFPLQDVVVGIFDEVGLASSLEDVLVFKIDLLQTAHLLQHLQYAIRFISSHCLGSSRRQSNMPIQGSSCIEVEIG